MQKKAKLIIETRARATPIIEIYPPHNPPPFGKPPIDSENQTCTELRATILPPSSWWGKSLDPNKNANLPHSTLWEFVGFLNTKAFRKPGLPADVFQKMCLFSRNRTSPIRNHYSSRDFRACLVNLSSLIL